MNLSTWLQARRGRALEMARHLRVSQVTVSDWSTGKKPVPLERCPYIEQFTGGEVTCEELKPDQVEYFAMLRERLANRSSVEESAPAPLVGEGA